MWTTPYKEVGGGPISRKKSPIWIAPNDNPNPNSNT